MAELFFHYGKEATGYLRKRDQALGRAIDRIGMVRRPVNPDLFAALVQSIAGQQVSAKAAATVWARMQERFGAIMPETVAAAGSDGIRACGISGRKAGYIHGIAAAVTGGDLDLTAIGNFPDEEVIRQLTSLHGVGRWTAEMLLIFSLERPDVVSRYDLAIRRGMMVLYGLDSLDAGLFERYRRNYSPYGSVASLYLWEISHE